MHAQNGAAERVNKKRGQRRPTDAAPVGVLKPASVETLAGTVAATATVAEAIGATAATVAVAVAAAAVVAGAIAAVIAEAVATE